MTAEEWYERAAAEAKAGQPVLILEIHEPCGGVILWQKRTHPRIRICACDDVVPTYTGPADLFARHGLEAVASRVGAAASNTAGRYD